MLQVQSVWAVALGLACTAAAAQFKCTDASGRVTFQQVECGPSARQQALQLRRTDEAASSPAAASAAGGTVEQRMVRQLERERKIRALTDEVARLETVVDQRNAAMNAELDGLRERKLKAKNNQAGATWEQSISTEMQAVTAKHQTLLSVELERLRSAKAELAAAQQVVASK